MNDVDQGLVCSKLSQFIESYIFSGACAHLALTFDYFRLKIPNWGKHRLTLETLVIFCNDRPFRAIFEQFFFTILEIYISKEPMQKIGSPAFICWSGGPLELSYFEPVYYDLQIHGKIWKNLGFAYFFPKCSQN